MTTKPFNRFPQDFTMFQGRRPVPHRFTRAIYDGTTLRVFVEKNKDITKIYETEVEEFVSLTNTGAKWTDPGGMQFSLVKSSGCGCKYNKLTLASTPDPEAE